jgi:succinoglycan biosynthesis protein ExoM
MSFTARQDPTLEIDDAGITICVCTFRRRSLLSTLQSLAAQILPDGAKYHTLVVDNDFSCSAETIVADFCAMTKMSVEYLHAPGQNISIARNAGLTACRTRWLAFIDDDETATPCWLGRLMAHRNGAVAIFGPCEAIYDPTAPMWIRIGDYHSNRVFRRNGVIETGYTSNVLIDMKFVRAERLNFDEQLGRTGGEDTMFFHAVYRRGGRLAYAADAVVLEKASSDRTTMAWVVTRKYRAGQIYAKLQQTYDSRKFRRLLFLSPLKIVFCSTIAAALVIRPARAMRWLMRGALHFGMLSYRLHGKIYQEY